MKTSTIIAVLIILLVIAGGAFWYSRSVDTSGLRNDNQSGQGSGDNKPTSNGEGNNSSENATVTVTYSDNGFTPAQTKIRKGDTVRFVNQSTGRMWVASAIHPTHTTYAGTSLSEHCPDTSNTAFDQCVAVDNDGTFEFTFDKVGAWDYHNHVRASQTGRVTVEE